MGSGGVGSSVDAWGGHEAGSRLRNEAAPRRANFEGRTARAFHFSKRHHPGDPLVDVPCPPPLRRADCEAYGEAGNQDLGEQRPLAVVVLIRGRVAGPSPQPVGARPGEPQAQAARLLGRARRPVIQRRTAGSWSAAAASHEADGAADALANIHRSRVGVRQRLKRRAIHGGDARTGRRGRAVPRAAAQSRPPERSGPTSSPWPGATRRPGPTRDAARA